MRPDGRQNGAHGRRLYSTWSLHFRQSYSEIILPCPPTPVKAFPRFALPSHRLYPEITGSYPQLPQSFQQPQPVVVQGIPGFFQNYAGPELVVFYHTKETLYPINQVLRCHIYYKYYPIIVSIFCILSMTSCFTSTYCAKLIPFEISV